MKHYFFCLLISSSALIAMDNVLTEDRVYEKIRDNIDVNILEINKSSCMRPIVGSICASLALWRYPSCMAEKDLYKIEGYLLQDGFNFKKKIFDKLIEKHWYVNGLVALCVNQKIEELKKVTGTTIDTFNNLYDETNKSVVNAIIKEHFENDFFSKLYFVSSFKKMRKTKLFEKGYDIDPFSLMLSYDEKYVQASNDKGVKKIWDIEKAEQVNEMNVINNIQWNESARTIKWHPRITSTYHTVYTNCTKQTDCGISIRINQTNPKIVVKMNQTPLLYAYCQAYSNSKYDRNELNALKKSKNFKNIGFLQKNIEKLID